MRAKKAPRFNRASIKFNSNKNRKLKRESTAYENQSDFFFDKSDCLLAFMAYIKKKGFALYQSRPISIKKQIMYRR